MRNFFTMVLVMVAVIALAAGPALAQSGSSGMDKEKMKKLQEFMKDSKTGGQQSTPAAKPAQTPPKPAVQTPVKPSVQTPAKPAVQTLPAVDKSKATYVGKVGEEKMSPARKACVDKCDTGRASCKKRCEQADKANDVMMKNECLSCSNTIIMCVNRCPAK